LAGRETDGAELAPVLSVVVHNTVAVNVSGVDDDSIVDAVRRTVRATLSHLVGTWHVKIFASADSRRWHLHLRGAFGHHVADFLSGPSMPDAVDRRLRAFLHTVAPPLSVPSGRPRLSYPAVRLTQVNAGAAESRMPLLLVSDRTARRQRRPATSRHAFTMTPGVDAAVASAAAAARRGGGESAGGRLDCGGSPRPH
jgi:hypothetical protein